MAVSPSPRCFFRPPQSWAEEMGRPSVSAGPEHGYVAPTAERKGVSRRRRLALLRAAQARNPEALRARVVEWKTALYQRKESQPILAWALLELVDAWTVQQLLLQGEHLAREDVERFLTQFAAQRGRVGWSSTHNAWFLETWEVLIEPIQRHPEWRVHLVWHLLRQAQGFKKLGGLRGDRHAADLDWEAMGLERLAGSLVMPWRQLDPSITHFLGEEAHDGASPLQIAWASGREDLCFALLKMGVSSHSPERGTLWPTWTLEKAVTDPQEWIGSLPESPPRALAEMFQRRIQDPDPSSYQRKANFEKLVAFLRAQHLERKLPDAQRFSKQARF